MDTVDSKIIAHLGARGRATWADLAEILGLSPPAVAERVRRLEQRGVIRGYAALVDAESVGYGLAAFVAVSLGRPGDRAAFTTLVRDLPEVQECHHVAGEDDYLLKVRCRSTRDLERIVGDCIKGLPGVVRTRTSVVLSTIKETTSLPGMAPEDVSRGP